MNNLAELYQKELKLLKESAQVFSAEHPAMTESLMRESADPDVEMILQGVSYLTAQFKREMDSQFPVALQALSQVLTPSLMQPIPAVTILGMQPKANLIKPLSLQKGKYFDSVPIILDGNDQTSQCRFTNVWDIEILPVQLKSLNVKKIEKNIDHESHRIIELNIDFDSSRNDLANYKFNKIRFYINQSMADAALWLLMFSRQLVGIEISDENGVHKLKSETINLSGFNHQTSIFNNEGTSYLHKMLQEYFIVPEKFLFVELDLNEWVNRAGEQFQIQMHFRQPNWALPTLDTDHLQMYCVPIINQFDHFAEPIAINSNDYEFPLKAKIPNIVKTELPIIDVIKVESIKRNRDKNRRYQNLLKPDSLNNKSDSFHFFRRHGSYENQINNCLALQFDFGGRPEAGEILRVKLSCCHGTIAGKINPGDVCRATSSSPELVSFKNLTVCTDFQQASIVSNTAWQVISDQALSLQTIETAEQLRNILTHHIPAQLQGSAKHKTNLHKIDAITHLKVEPRDHIKNGVLKRGFEYRVSINGEHFINLGDSFLFTAVLDQLFALQAPLNNFSQLIIIDIRTGEELEWPLRMGTATS